MGGRAAACEAITDGDERLFDAACGQICHLERIISATRAQGLKGVAVKAYLLHFHAYRLGVEGDPAALCPTTNPDELDGGLFASLIGDIAAMVPELAPLCAAALAE
jgi:hypothetical protein